MRIAILLLVTIAVVCGGSTCRAAGLGHDESGNIKMTFSSLPFFGDSDDEDERDSRYDDYDPDEEEYTTDSLGRKVPVKTRKGGTAIRGF